eukprot:scaffold236945_cov19-Tisochrysis_lutea.AAC.1
MENSPVPDSNQLQQQLLDLLSELRSTTDAAVEGITSLSFAFQFVYQGCPPPQLSGARVRVCARLQLADTKLPSLMLDAARKPAHDLFRSHAYPQDILMITRSGSDQGCTHLQMKELRSTARVPTAAVKTPGRRDIAIKGTRSQQQQQQQQQQQMGVA